MNRTHFDRTATQSEDDWKSPPYDDLSNSPNQAKRAVLLLNLGYPNSTSVREVRSDLDEFLSDDGVLRPAQTSEPVRPCLSAVMATGGIAITARDGFVAIRSQIFSTVRLRSLDFNGHHRLGEAPSPSPSAVSASPSYWVGSV